MPAAGQKPKEGQKHGRTPVVHEWTEVPDVPYEGECPELPETRRFIDAKLGGAVFEMPLSDETHEWWEAISTMPHCTLWSEADWRFAVDTALVADAFFQGDTKAATELRIREKVMGTTLDARRDLRIRYVDAAAQPTSTRRASNVTSLDDRRRRLSDAS